MIPVTAVLQAATVLNHAETLVGEIRTTDFKSITLWLDYVEGNEQTIYVVPKVLRVEDGTEYPLTNWQCEATAVPVQRSLLISNGGNYYVSFDVGGIELVKVYVYAVGGTPTGTFAVSYTMTEY